MVIAKSKKYKPQMNNTIKNMDSNWSPGLEQIKKQETGVPKAIFIPHGNSLPFEERRVTLEEPVKTEAYSWGASINYVARPRGGRDKLKPYAEARNRGGSREQSYVVFFR
ncbi:hypothetical protein EVAR_18944_1 [Eumeta japonica]|uniref:Uncharacterized protein n=1 Tax=Eumeta variegata TaxID=151549 RepID=A0A4C1V2M7_EUMVA|nr:hypothetical protein EVAR_18944_1 [Eumeta japonica]